MTSIVATPPTELSGSVFDRDAASQATVPGQRIHYFDWLRAIAVLGVVVYHTFLPFARSTWLVRNAEQSDLLLAVVLLFETFGLAILFLIAGVSARFALQHRSVRVYLGERAGRLLLPFVVGALVVVPPTGYIIGRHIGTVSGSFLAYLMAHPSTVLAYTFTNVGLSPELLTSVGMHLWFLGWLFICSALALPTFAFLKSAIGRSCVDALARLARWRGAMLLLGVPVTLPRLVLYALSSADQGWALEAFAWYAIIFVVGCLLYTDDRFVAAARRDLGLALIVAVVGSAALLAADFVQWSAVPQTYGAKYFLMLSLVGITGWAWTLTVLGVGMRAGFMQRPLPARAGEAALPTYVLHFPIVIAISILVVQWPLGIGAKILVNGLLGVAASLLVATALLMISLLRPLLGVRRLRPNAVQQGTPG
jgi:glucans biosynthesis protein C